jgi:hypothetical protein
MTQRKLKLSEERFMIKVLKQIIRDKKTPIRVKLDAIDRLAFYVFGHKVEVLKPINTASPGPKPSKPAYKSSEIDFDELYEMAEQVEAQKGEKGATS